MYFGCAGRCQSMRAVGAVGAAVVAVGAVGVGAVSVLSGPQLVGIKWVSECILYVSQGLKW